MKYKRSFLTTIRVDVAVVNSSLRLINNFRKLFSFDQYYHKCGIQQDINIPKSTNKYNIYSESMKRLHIAMPLHIKDDLIIT